MSEEQKEINVEATRRFDKTLKKLSAKDLTLVEDQIDLIIENPEIGTRKKGDLSYLWVHKFKIKSQLMMIGYSWLNNELRLYLLNIGTHENFYDDMKRSRKHDLNFID
ncbi:type II toxin-antitoxin system RelE/ParE family toxin (plasmid) [Photobacterium leiognathi subsp. mandapamensis]|uniref:type II toxin-antitoxin system RelE/ParE family toxin n=1 Tax=Photobacterium leiognathi TaxID=553611 RepID=UPI003AF343C3